MRCSIVPIGDIHLFIGETDSGTSSLGVRGASRPARTAYGLDMFAEASMSDLSSEFTGKDRKASRPTRTAYGLDTFAEGSMSDLSSEFAGKDRKSSRPTQTAPCAGYKGGRSLQIRRLCPRVWTAEIQVRQRGYHLRSGALRSERGRKTPRLPRQVAPYTGRPGQLPR